MGLFDLIEFGAQDSYLMGYRKHSDHPKLIQLRNCAGPVAHDIEKFIIEIDDDNIKGTINSIDIIQRNTGECWTAAALIYMKQMKKQ